MSPFQIVGFDVDGTLVVHPRGWTVWEVLNDRFTGSSEINQERYAAYKAGELSYADWVRLDVTGWRAAGARKEDVVAAFGELTLVDGVRETLQALKDSGVRVVAISGTLDVMLHTMLPDAPFEEIWANHIGFGDDGAISHWEATPFDMDGKETILRALAMREGVPLERCAYVGDSDNDAWIAQAAGLFVAFNPKTEKTESLAGVVVRSNDLRDVLPHLLGEPAG
jgi:phosphoserine phosphatase